MHLYILFRTLNKSVSLMFFNYITDSSSSISLMSIIFCFWSNQNYREILQNKCITSSLPVSNTGEAKALLTTRPAMSKTSLDIILKQKDRHAGWLRQDIQFNSTPYFISYKFVALHTISVIRNFSSADQCWQSHSIYHICFS